MAEVLEHAPHEARQPLLVERRDDGATVGRVGERQQRAVAVVGDIEVQLRRREPLHRLGQQRAQRRRATGERTAEEQHVGVVDEVPAEHALLLLARHVLEPEHERVGGDLALREAVEREQRRQRQQPRRRVAGDAHLLRRRAHEVDERPQVGVVLVGAHALARRITREARGRAERRPLDLGLGRQHRRRTLHTETDARDARRLERDRCGARAGAHVAAAGGVRPDQRGLRRTEHVGGVAAVGDAQGDAEVDVGLHLRRDHAGGALRREHEVDAERATHARDAHEAIDEVGELRLELGELVDDDHEAGEAEASRGIRILRPRGVDVLRGELAQHALAALELGVERGEGALGLAGVEVRDHADGVRQALAVRERRSALVVDEDEVERVGPVGHRERDHEGLQELRFARAGRAGDERVGTVLGDVDRELTVRARADDDVALPRRRAPAGHERVGVVEVDAEELGVAHATGQHALIADATHMLDRAQAAGDGLGAGNRQAVEQHGGEVVGVRLEARHRVVALVDRDHRAALLRQAGTVGVERDDMDAVLGPLVEQVHHARQHAVAPRAVDEHDELGVEGSALTASGAHAGLEDGVGLAQALPARVIRVADEGHDRVAELRVGQPLRPRPLALVVVVAQHEHLQVARRAQHREGAEHGPRRVAHGIERPREAHDAGPEVSGDRRRPDADLAVTVLVLLRTALEAHVEGNLGDADTDLQRILVAQPALPQARQRPRRDVADDDRVGHAVPGVEQLLPGESADAHRRILDLLDPLRLRALALALGELAVREERADDHDGRRRRHEEHDHSAEEHGHRDTEHDRDRGREPRQRGLVELLRLVARQRELGLAGGRLQARRTVEAAHARCVRRQVGVGCRRDSEPEHAAADLHDIGRNDRGGAREPFAIDVDGSGRIRRLERRRERGTPALGGGRSGTRERQGRVVRREKGIRDEQLGRRPAAHRHGRARVQRERLTRERPAGDLEPRLPRLQLPRGDGGQARTVEDARVGQPRILRSHREGMGVHPQRLGEFDDRRRVVDLEQPGLGGLRHCLRLAHAQSNVHAAIPFTTGAGRDDCVAVRVMLPPDPAGGRTSRTGRGSRRSCLPAAACAARVATAAPHARHPTTARCR